MVAFILIIQISSLVFFYGMLESAGDFWGDVSYTFEKKLWYFIAGFNSVSIIRFIYVELNFSYPWYDKIMEFISFGISLLIVIPTAIYYLIKRRRNRKKKIRK